MIRCWARHFTSGEFCAEPMNHSSGHTWFAKTGYPDRFSAHEAGADGRETAALRILEVAHEIDRLAFQCGDMIGEYDALRAIASRLYCNTIAASADLLSIEHALNGLEIDSEATEQERQSAEETITLIQQAADILRPFAESK